MLIYFLGDIAFIKNKTSPNLITVREGGQLTLRCSYCTVTSLTASLSWHKEGLVISNDSRHVIQKDKLGIPVVEHSRDEGLYECVVTSKNQNISRFITVIVMKGRIKYNDLLTFNNLLDSDDDFRSGCRNVSHCHLKQSFSGLHSPG